MSSKLVVSVYNLLPRWISSRIVRLVKPTYPVGCVVVVFDENEDVLVLRHTYHKPPWRLPGGLVERMERPFDAARREVWEEASCRVEPRAIVDVRITSYTVDIVILAELLSIAPFHPNAEVDKRRFIRRTELADLPRDQQPLIQTVWNYREMLRKVDSLEGRPKQ